MESLKQENTDLKRSLRLLTTKVEQNEQLLRSFFDMEIRLFSCSNLAELLDLILVEFKDHFQLSAVNLMLLDPENAARDLLESYTPPQPEHSLRFVDNQQLLKSLFPTQTLRVGELSPPLKSIAFPRTPYILSSALLPLIRHNCLIGSLHLGSNDPDRYSDHFDYDYINHLASVIAVCIENCINQQNMKRLSIIDMLTKVYNRRAFDQEIIKELSRASRHDRPLSCLFIDLDYFKLVNDNFGHQIGDKVLRAIGLLLRQNLRKTDFVARYGGEEFAILLPNCDSHKAMQISDQLRNKIAHMVIHNSDNTPFRISASIGVTHCTSASFTFDDLNAQAHALLKAADEAVYQAKEKGRNRVEYRALPNMKPELFSAFDTRDTSLSPVSIND
ncbi:sensor domain-containing diguanylate cyclase [Amphritea opalescens]|uniref:diguanylate cyclase n=1 Tax=Amphritea opalescens TaxID=2490544 RepID=A0A430KMC3_9GAMM|nr:sensor domain-containing diguanylate cyclase [Amphritea opalescens]RTE64604.1 sensor domain-containing diguanylate cyclase [Amphritea opalescens]